MTPESFRTWARANKKGLIFFGDEFEYLYRYTNEHSITIVKQVLSLGKSTLALGVISGSAVDLRALAYKENRDDPRYQEYPDLNHSVYVEWRLDPIRNRCDFIEALKVKQLPISDEDKIYFCTVA